MTSSLSAMDKKQTLPLPPTPTTIPTSAPSPFGPNFAALQSSPSHSCPRPSSSSSSCPAPSSSSAVTKTTKMELKDLAKMTKHERNLLAKEAKSQAKSLKKEATIQAKEIHKQVKSHASQLKKDFKEAAQQARRSMEESSSSNNYYREGYSTSSYSTQPSPLSRPSKPSKPSPPRMLAPLSEHLRYQQQLQDYQLQKQLYREQKYLYRIDHREQRRAYRDTRHYHRRHQSHPSCHSPVGLITLGPRIVASVLHKGAELLSSSQHPIQQSPQTITVSPAPSAPQPPMSVPYGYQAPHHGQSSNPAPVHASTSQPKPIGSPDPVLVYAMSNMSLATPASVSMPPTSSLSSYAHPSAPFPPFPPQAPYASQAHVPMAVPRPDLDHEREQEYRVPQHILPEEDEEDRTLPPPSYQDATASRH